MSKERIRRISLLFTEGEYEAVKSLAGAMPLTRFFKALVVESVQRAHVEAIRAAGVKETTEVGEFDYQLNPKFVENENRGDKIDPSEVPTGRSVPSRRGRPKVLAPPESHPVPNRGGNFCKHGAAKGNNCWQCGGLAVIE